MTEPEWYRQRMLACEFCGQPGHYIAIAPPIDVMYTSTADVTAQDFTIHTRITCPEHRTLVRQRAEREQDPGRFATDHGRPETWGETNPERMSKSLGLLIDRLKEHVPEQAADLEAQARAKGLL